MADLKITYQGDWQEDPATGEDFRWWGVFERSVPAGDGHATVLAFVRETVDGEITAPEYRVESTNDHPMSDDQLGAFLAAGQEARAIARELSGPNGRVPA